MVLLQLETEGDSASSYHAGPHLVLQNLLPPGENLVEHQLRHLEHLTDVVLNEEFSVNWHQPAAQNPSDNWSLFVRLSVRVFVCPPSKMGAKLNPQGQRFAISSNSFSMSLFQILYHRIQIGPSGPILNEH